MSDRVTIAKLRNAKTLAYVIYVDGVPWARVLSLPLAEKMVPLFTESMLNGDRAIRSLARDSGIDPE